MTKAELVGFAALAESYSTHPIARSIIEHFGGEIDRRRVGNVEEIPGHGVKADVDGRAVAVGNAKLMDSVGAKWRDYGAAGAVVHVAVDDQYEGCIVISDTVKADAKQTIDDLRYMGVNRTVMLTGDSSAIGEMVADELGLDDVYSELLPGDKVEHVERLIGETAGKGALIFVGDGINDAPVLSRADVGVAMGALGSDAAIEAADVVLMNDRPSRIATAISIARKTQAIVKQNIVFALGVKGLVLILSAVGLANMWGAVFADVGVAVLAILNAMRALKFGE